MVYEPTEIITESGETAVDLVQDAFEKCNQNFEDIAEEFSLLPSGGGSNIADMLTGTQTGIGVTYDEENDELDFVVAYGTEANTACQGNDERLSDSRSPTTHSHSESDITDLGSYSVTGHSHSESDITDLGSYSPTGHTHSESDITDLGSYAASSHTHGSGDITDATSTPTGARIPISDAQGTLDSWVSLSTKADTDHNHDGDYSAADHDLTHLLGGTDEIDGDQIGVDFTPENYTPATVENISDDLDHLSSHLQGIDTAIGASSGITAGKSIALSIVFGG